MIVIKIDFIEYKKMQNVSIWDLIVESNNF